MFDALLARAQERERRKYVRAGIVAAAIYNAAPFRDSRAKVFSPLDFVPSFGEEKRQSMEEQIQTVAAAFGCGPKETMDNG